MTARYKIVPAAGGNRYLFYCDISGALACTTLKTYRAFNARRELERAWLKEGRRHFCRCRKCGRWVIDAMFNADVCECVVCAPYEADARFCKHCGEEITAPVKHCPTCGKLLVYEGGVMLYDAKRTI